MCISAYSLMPYISLLLPYISFISCTCWVPTISVLNLAIFPCHSNLLLRRRRWTGIPQRGVLGYASPRLPFLWLWSLPLFRFAESRLSLYGHQLCNNYTLYFWHLVICKHFWPYVWNNWSWVMHTMSTRFWHKNRVWQKWYQSRVNRRNASQVRRILSLILSSSICESTLF
jgi:hypothetical protein